MLSPLAVIYTGANLPALSGTHARRISTALPHPPSPIFRNHRPVLSVILLAQPGRLSLVPIAVLFSIMLYALMFPLALSICTAQDITWSVFPPVAPLPNVSLSFLYALVLVICF